jgi:hypothetical protein
MMKFTITLLLLLFLSHSSTRTAAVFERLNRWIEDISSDGVVSHGDSMELNVDVSSAGNMPPNRDDIYIAICNTRNNKTLCESRLSDHIESGVFPCSFHESDVGFVNGVNHFDLIVHSNSTGQVFVRHDIFINHFDHTIIDGYYFYNETEIDSGFHSTVITVTSLASYGILRKYPKTFAQIGMEVMRRVHKLQEGFGPLIGSFINSDMQKEIAKFLLVHNPFVDIFTHPVEHLKKLKKAADSLGDVFKGLLRKMKGEKEPAVASVSSGASRGNKGGGKGPSPGAGTTSSSKNKAPGIQQLQAFAGHEEQLSQLPRPERGKLMPRRGGYVSESKYVC